jgi:hypothetical protein
MTRDEIGARISSPPVYGRVNANFMHRPGYRKIVTERRRFGFEVAGECNKEADDNE